MKKYTLAIHGNRYTVQLLEVSTEEIKAEVNGTVHTVTIEDIEHINMFAEEPAPQRPAPVSKNTAISAKKVQDSSGDYCSFGSGNLQAPIPGQIITIDVKPGDSVNKGDRLLILEAMKMENILTATRNGVVREVLVEAGEAVTQDQMMIVFE